MPKFDRDHAVRNIIKSGLVYAGARLLPQVANLLLLPVYTRYLDPEEFAILAIAQAIVTIATILFSLGLDRAIFRLYWQYKQQDLAGNYIGTTFVSIAAGSAVICGASAVTSVLIISDSELAISVLLALATSFAQSFMLVPLALLQVLERPVSFAFQNLTLFLVQTSISLYAIIFLDAGAEGVLVAQLLATILVLPISFINIRRFITFVFDKRVFWDAFNYSWPLVPVLISGWVLTMADRILLTRAVTLSELGVYSMAVRLVSAYSMGANTLFQAYNPIYNKTRSLGDRASGKVRCCNIVIMYILVSAGTLVIALGSSIVTRCMDPLYHTGIEFIPLLTLGAFFYAASGFANLDVYYVKRTRIVMFAQIVAALLHIAMILWAVGFLSFYAAIVAGIVSPAVGIAIKYARLSSNEKTYVPWGMSSMLMCSAAFSGILALKHYIFYIPLVVVLVISMILVVKNTMQMEAEPA